MLEVSVTTLLLPLPAYILGSIPFGLILAKLFGRTDVRKGGSGNIGATNVARVAGPVAGILTLILDVAKGSAAVLLAARLSQDSPTWMMIAAVLFSVLFYSLFLPFADAASVRFQDPDALAGFLGVFWAAVTGAAFLVAIVATNRLLGWLGAGLLVLVLPVLYAGSFAALLVSSALTTLVVIRFVVNVWGVGYKLING